jgi:Type II secretory pathway, component PulF
MKKFTYTAKDVFGAFKQGEIDAEGRVVALTSLKAKGLTPISVKEIPTGFHRNRQEWQRRRKLFVILVGCVVIVTAWLAMERCKRGKMFALSSPTEVLIHTHIATKQSKDNTNQIEAIKPRHDNKNIHKNSSPTILLPEQSRTSPIDGLMTQGGSDEGQEDITNSSPQRAFMTGTEQSISWMANTRLGDPVPPLPMLPLKESIVDILKTDIVVFDDDNEKVIQAKTNVAHTKQIMKEYVDNGGDPQDFLEFYRNELQNAYEERQKGQKELMRLLREADLHQAKLFVEQCNRDLEKKGIRLLTVPPIVLSQ